MNEDQIINRIRQLLDAKDWTPYRLSKEAGIPNSSINSIFQRNAYPTIPTLIKICGAFRISLSEFFNFEAIPLRYGELTPDEQEMLSGFQDLTQHKKSLLLAYLQGLSND